MRVIRSRIAVLAALLALVAAACAGASEETKAFCGNMMAVEAMFGADEPDPGAIETLLTEIESGAPEDVAGDTGTLVAAARTVLETGDFSAMDSDEFMAAEVAVDEFMVDECGYPTLTVTAQDPTNGSADRYEFADAPESLRSGTSTL
jgi:hypothetical protein